MGVDAWGVDDGWFDTAGQWHDVGPDTRAALRAAMGDPPPDAPGVRILRPGDGGDLEHPARLLLEDGSDLGEVSELAPDLPLGLHRLDPADGAPPTTLLVSPGRCHLPEGLRTWGLAVQVPTSRSRASWGIGDLADVRSLARWVGGQGGGAVGLSPLHAATPVAPLPASPYSPSSRRWRHPLLLRIEEVAGAAGDPVVEGHGRAARALRDAPLLDRDAAWGHKQAALDHLWAALPSGERTRLDAWRAQQGAALEGWARFCALAEVHGADWTAWPADLRRPESPAVAAAVRSLDDRVAHHAWLQLLLEDQLTAARTDGVRLVQDLAIGADPHGADGWLLQDLLALDVSIGAPPDDFEPDGQRWGLPPFVPWRLRAAGYRPLAELLSASMATGGGLRVDHVMGLTRLFWIPPGASPQDGGYVRFHGHELLEVLALESARAGSVVVGEDLGTVEPELRAALSDARVLSTRVVWFEDGPPSAHPVQSLAMATTHDLPTIAGVWTGADEAELAALGRPVPPDGARAVRERLQRLVDLPDGAPVPEVVERAHARLSEGASALVLGTLEDACGLPHRPNVPGTTSERPANWSLPLPLAIEDIPEDPASRAAVEALAAPRRPRPTG